MRERLTALVKKLNSIRITPAYAGKTMSFGFLPSAMRDHPRVCGKDRCILRLIVHLLGSPPRMRERHGCGTTTILSSRITPAYAGKTELHYRAIMV